MRGISTGNHGRTFRRQTLIFNSFKPGSKKCFISDLNFKTMRFSLLGIIQQADPWKLELEYNPYPAEPTWQLRFPNSLLSDSKSIISNQAFFPRNTNPETPPNAYVATDARQEVDIYLKKTLASRMSRSKLIKTK